MIWSYSAAKMFRQCQFQWFLKTKVANANAKDPFRREIYLLSKLQSLRAWRGQVVDQLLGTEIMKALDSRQHISLDALVRKVRSRFASQADFARRHRIREPRMSPVKAGAAFAAWNAIEYVEPITDADIEMAWRDVELALARCQPHMAFPAPSHIGDAAELRLLVVQPLTAQQRAYRLRDENIATAEDLIPASADQMLR